MVPRAGLEPARSCLRGILSPLCLPIPPPGQLVCMINSSLNLSIRDKLSIKAYKPLAGHQKEKPEPNQGFSFALL